MENTVIVSANNVLFWGHKVVFVQIQLNLRQTQSYFGKYCCIWGKYIGI